MRIKMGNLSDWIKLDKDDAVMFEASALGKIVLQVNPEALTRISYEEVRIDKNAQSSSGFVCVTSELTEIEINSKYALQITFNSKSPVWIRSEALLSREILSSGESFTEPVERRYRNPEVAALLQKQAYERLLVSEQIGALRREMEQIRADKIEDKRAGNNRDADASRSEGSGDNAGVDDGSEDEAKRGSEKEDAEES